MDSVDIASKQDAHGRRLIAKFFRLGDRYAHSVLLMRGDQETVLLTSVEGDEQAKWPPSPPLQQLTVEHRPDGGPVLLLVGMAARSHWSVSVETDPSAAVLMFDVACRVHETSPARLGSCYRISTQHRSYSESQTDAIELPEHGCRIVAKSCGKSLATAIEASPEAIAILPSLPSGSPPYTVRWKYRIETLCDGKENQAVFQNL